MDFVSINLGISLQVVEQDIDTDSKISSSEGIRSVPTLWSKFPSLDEYGMEVD